MTKKIESLTKEQETQLKASYTVWLTQGRSCEPSDRKIAERVWKEMYQALGKKEPYIWWCDGPAVGSIVRTMLISKGANLWDNLGANLGDNLWANLGANLWDNLGANLRGNLWDNLGANLRDNLWDNLGANLRDNLRDNLGANLRANLGANLWANLRDNLGANLRDNLWANLGANLRGNLWANLGANLWDNLGWNFWGQHELYWPAYYSWPDKYLRKMHTEEQRKRLQWWLDLSNTGWWHAYEGIIFACERPKRQEVDERGRLHRSDGPAILCRDSWEVYAWHGVRVTEKVINGEFAQADVLQERNNEVRRAMLEIKGLDWFWDAGKPKIIHHDRDGYGNERQLAELHVEGAQNDKLRVIRYQCPSTDRIYVDLAPRNATTCQAAIAAKFKVKEYAPEYEG